MPKCLLYAYKKDNSPLLHYSIFLELVWISVSHNRKLIIVKFTTYNIYLNASIVLEKNFPHVLLSSIFQLLSLLPTRERLLLAESQQY